MILINHHDDPAFDNIFFNHPFQIPGLLHHIQTDEIGKYGAEPIGKKMDAAVR